MTRFTLRQLAYFVAAADALSTIKASRSLNVSQPAISAAISHLEVALGYKLFIRHHAQGLSLTSSGSRFLGDARGLLEDAEQLARGSRNRDGNGGGEIDVGFYTNFGPYLIPRTLTSFRKSHPKVTVRIHEGDAEQVYAGLTSGKFDVAFTFDFGLGPGIVRELLAEWPPYVALPVGHPLARRSKLSFSQLVNEQFIVTNQPYVREYFSNVFESAGVEPTVKYRTGSIEMLRSLVANGHGVGLLVTRPALDTSYDGRKIVCRGFSSRVPAMRVVLVRLAQTELKGPLDAFVKCARQILG